MPPMPAKRNRQPGKSAHLAGKASLVASAAIRQPKATSGQMRAGNPEKSGHAGIKGKAPSSWLPSAKPPRWGP